MLVQEKELTPRSPMHRIDARLWFLKGKTMEGLPVTQLAPMNSNPSETFAHFANYDAICKINKIKHDVYITPCHFRSRTPGHRVMG